MKRHVQDGVRTGSNKNRIVECQHCGIQLRSDILNRHLVTHNTMRSCKFCKKLLRRDKLLKHETLCHDKVDETLCNRAGVQRLETSSTCSSVCGYFNFYKLNVENSNDYDKIIESTLHSAKVLLQDFVKQQSIKAQIVIELLFYKHTVGEREVSEKVFRSLCEPLLMGDDIDSFLNRAKIYIRARIDEYERHGSGWIFDQLQCSHLEVAKYSPLSASGTVAIPQEIKKMRSVLNITSTDNRCFLYCLVSKFKTVKKHPDRYTKYLDNLDIINMGNVTFPVKISDIPKIEQLNQISISVFEWNIEEKCVIPLKHGSGIGTQIDLLYIQDDDTAHYLLIKEFNAFMRHRTKYHHSMFYCRKCLHGFTKEPNLVNHTKACSQGINQRVTMPPPGEIEFKTRYKQEKKLFVLYFDFESLVVPIHGCETKPKRNGSSTVKYQKHVPCSFSIVTKSEFSNYNEETVVYTHDDPDNVTETFIKELNRIYTSMMKCYEENQHPIDMTQEDEKKFKNSKTCHICAKTLDWESSNNYPVRDHDHTKKTDNFRGAAHNFCNINYFERTKKVPAFCHNLKGYDLNLFLLDLVKHVEKIMIIPENIERFKSIITDNYIFLDSFAFLSTSLDNLTENLKTTGMNSFSRLQKEFPLYYEDLTNKGVYFYDYASSYTIFSEKELPPKSKFYNKQKDESLSEKNYQRAQDIYNRTGCKTLLDYMLLYVLTDAVLLCDVFENFRNLCMEYYGLDPCHFFSLPAFTWDAMLKMTGVKLEYITDINQYTFIEKNIRGGVTTINHRHFKANNKYLDDYNPEIPSSYIHYIDCNNLYGASMMGKLPTGGFKWLEEKDVMNFDVIGTDADADFCYILEVDLRYPSSIHDTHNDYPLAVECKLIMEEDLSPYNKQFLVEQKEKFKSCKKLCPDLKNKKNYVCSLKNLQFFISQGIVLEKIHKILIAKQSAFLKPYIEFNSSKRLNAQSKFESDFFKMCNNAIYGKTIEDLRKRTKVDVVKDPKKAKKLTSRPQYKGFHILDEDITVVQSMKGKIILNKPITCGFMVLENAKFLMGSFWYTVLKAKYGEKIKLLLSDTDSFVYAAYTEDGYQDLHSLRQYMDLSGYVKAPLLTFHDPINKKIPGKFSDEMPKQIIRESINLKPKMYSLLTKKLDCTEIEDDSDHECNNECFVGHSSTAKGVKKSAKKKITHEDYRNVLESRGTTIVTARTIRSFKHNLYSIVVNKRGLSSYDDKKFILHNGIDTLSYGHYRLKEK